VPTAKHQRTTRFQIQQDILTITLNPAVDLATSVEQVIPGRKLYCKKPRIDPGGGGVNVARAIYKLGGSSKALVAAGGASGQKLLNLLAQEDVPVHPVDVGGETRESMAVTDESSREQYRFSLPGDPLTPDVADLLIDEIIAQTPHDGYVVLSGGLAPGLESDYPECIRSAIASRTEKLIVDTSKSALVRLVRQPVAPIYLLRLNQKEAEQSAGHPLENVAETLKFATEVIDRGVTRNIVIGRAAEGSVFVSSSARYICRVPQQGDIVSKIGAGDAFLGGLTLSLARGVAMDVALRWGAAAASATMATAGTGLCELTSVKSLLPLCEVQSV